MDQRRSRALAWSLLGATILIASIDATLVVLTWGAPQPTGSFGVRGPGAAIGVLTAAIGALVVARHPSNPIGWLLCATGVVGAALDLPALYGTYALFIRSGALPGGELAAWLSAWVWIPILVLLGLLFLLYPEGRMLSPRWRWVALPQEVEATAYFCVLEALQNAGKYSEAAGVRIVLEASAKVLSFEVADDGRGFDLDTTARGSGLRNMADRLEAAGGSLEIQSWPGEGTRVSGRVPVGERAAP